MTVNWFTASQSFAATAEIHQPHMVARDGAIGPRVFHLDAIAEHLVKGAVGLRERRRRQPQHLPHRVFACLLGNLRVQPLDGLAQTPHQHHVAKALALRRGLAWCQVRPVRDRIAQLPEPSQGGVFDGGFVEGHGFLPSMRLISRSKSEMYSASCRWR